MNLIKRFARNVTGRDLVVGDVHGCFTKLQAHLDSIGFDPAAGDRLFSVGDLVDRGPESDSVTDWLARPWFHAVRGNHEDMAIRWPDGNMDAGNYAANGGMWNVMNPASRCMAIADALELLPVAIEVDTSAGPVGIVHADVPSHMSWSDFTGTLATGWVRMASGEMRNSRTALNGVIDCAMWNRARVEARMSGFDVSSVDGVVAVIVGHTPVERPTWAGNLLNIDTAGWHPDGHGFTVIDLATLEPVLPRGDSASVSGCHGAQGV